ncbi:LysR substrate-binding domain-containing protein [Pseudomonas frederiksbergensis]|uniref:LysR substrate-binding domain-containing protein n=1 Tax=Pseudomonas frederiksbergensis TaxID=104087 RepID=UPI003D1DFDD1
MARKLAPPRPQNSAKRYSDGIGGSDVWPATLEHRYLGSEWHIFCASPAYLSKHGTPVTDRDLEHHQCIAYGWADGTVSPWSFSGKHPGEIERRAIAAKFVVGDGEGLVIAVSAGCGIAQLPSWLIKRQLEEGTLVEVQTLTLSRALLLSDACTF